MKKITFNFIQAEIMLGKKDSALNFVKAHFKFSRRNSMYAHLYLKHRSRHQPLRKCK